MYIRYPNLASEIAKRGIKKRVIAERLGVSERTLYSKMTGKVEFTWPETCTINAIFFPDMEKDVLFAEVKNNAS